MLATRLLFSLKMRGAPLDERADAFLRIRAVHHALPNLCDRIDRGTFGPPRCI